jgi:hypothetical protein
MVHRFAQRSTMVSYCLKNESDLQNDYKEMIDVYETICFLHFIHALIHWLVYAVHFQIYRSCAVSVITDQYIRTYSKLYVSTDYLDFVIIEFEIWFWYQRRNGKSVSLWSVRSELRQFLFDDCSSSAHKLFDSSESQIIGTIAVLKSF